jgi:hypothetical protein
MHFSDIMSLNSSHNEKYCRESQDTFYVQYLFSENRAVCVIMWKNRFSHTGHRWQYNTARTFCMPGSKDKNTDTRTLYLILMLFHGNEGYANALQCVHCLSRYFYQFRISWKYVSLLAFDLFTEHKVVTYSVCPTGVGVLLAWLVP